MEVGGEGAQNTGVLKVFEKCWKNVYMKISKMARNSFLGMKGGLVCTNPDV